MQEDCDKSAECRRPFLEECRVKILHVTPYFAPAWAYGGPPRSIHGLCREFVRRGHSVTVATTDALDASQRATRLEEEMDGIHVLRFRNLSNRLAWKQLYLPLGMGTFLKKRLRDFDVVHLHMYRTTQDVITHRYGKKYGIPYVFSARGTLLRIVRQRATKALFDAASGYRLLRDAAWLVALSSAEKSHYECMGVSPSRISIIFNGIDVDSFRRVQSRGIFAERHCLDGKRIITYLGRLNARKGLEHLLKAFREVYALRQDAALVLAGPDEGTQVRLEKLANALSISRSVVFPGLVTNEERLQVLADSDVIVYPGYHEVFGLVPFEALACGKPVVVSDDSGCGEIVRKAGAGFTVPFGDALRWRDAIIAALEGGPGVEEMVHRGRSFVREKLSWPAIAAAMETVYWNALENPTSHPIRPKTRALTQAKS